MLRSIKGRISVRGTNDANKRNKKLTFKNNATFRSCISKINNTITENGEDLDIAVPMYNLLEYSGNYSADAEANEIDHTNNNINNNKTITSKSFEYKTNIIGNTSNNNNVLDTEVAVPLKYLSNF